jgi:superfamily II DNA helicase RecQ
LVWGQVCDLYNIPFPITGVSLVGIDCSPGSLDHASQVVHAYAEALQRMMDSRQSNSSSEDNPSCSVPILNVVHDWAVSSNWKLFDLKCKSILDFDCEPNIVFAAAIWNELDKVGKENFDLILQQLPNEAIVIVIEPGSEKAATALMGWRTEFFNKYKKFTSLGPCGQEFGYELPKVCSGCWNSRRESFQQTNLYNAFRKACEDKQGFEDKRRFDDYENNLLSWSYVVIAKQTKLKNNALLIEGLRDKQTISDVNLRYIGSYRKKELFAGSPDESLKPSEYHSVEYLKVCPAKYENTLGLLVERKLGFQIAVLQYGQSFFVSHVSAEQVTRNQQVLQGIYKLVRTDNTKLLVNTRPSSEKILLSVYNSRVKLAIDDIAYRLFGFPGMREFQHEILRRSLQGKNILGIAATGGGKSECFILPAMLLPGITIVIAPLKSLMVDQFEQRIKERYGLDHLTTYINGDINFQERQSRLKRMELGYYKLIYFTPEQLERGYILDSLKRADEEVGIRYLAMDEAHCISQWGHDFRPAYLNISYRLQEYGINPCLIALTATASPKVRKDICEEFRLDPTEDVFVYSSNRPEINLVVRVKQSIDEKTDDILREIERLKKSNQYNQQPGAAIIFMPHTGGSPENDRKYLPAFREFISELENIRIPSELEDKFFYDFPNKELVLKGLLSEQEKDILLQLSEDKRYQKIISNLIKKSLGSQQGKSSATVNGFGSFIERRIEQKISIYHSKVSSEVQDDDDKEKSISKSSSFGDFRNRTKEEEQRSFIKGERNIMVATKGFGLGIDKSNIRLVIHRTSTANLEAYAQEAGRAGRDGEISTAILYYSPDRNPKKQDSDHDIQSFFLNNRYVRSEDISVMSAFLHTIQRGVTIPRKTSSGQDQYLYFTNDEAIYFFDRCTKEPLLAGLKSPYIWIEFEEREELSSYVSKEHQKILDEGHIYNNKTNYINRILAALYRIRPSIPPETRMLTLISKLQEAGAYVKKFKIKNWDNIIQSNTYFGEILRRYDVSRSEFENALKENSLLEFSQRLEMSVSELQAMLSDIKLCDGANNKRGHWESALLDFWWIEAPKFSPAPDLNQSPHKLETWRNYAGAKGRSNPKRSGRINPTIDDYFPWKELNQSKGWEILPGEAFYDQDNFEEYVEAFIRLHNEREADDWASYHRLLTSYIGVNEDGTIPDVRKIKSCLRAIMLGYLKTYEVVSGGNCLSCNCCVPGENFEKYTIEQRRKVVVKIGPETERLLNEAEQFAEVFPEEILIDTLFAAAKREQQEGRSVIQYIEGWSGRLLQDIPDHPSALLIRIKAMAEGLFELQAQEFIGNAKRLIRLITNTDKIQIIWKIIAESHKLLPNEPDIYRIQIQLRDRLNLLSGLEESINELIELLQKSSTNRSELVELYTRLEKMYAPKGFLENPDKHQRCLLRLARLSTDARQAMSYYKSVISIWEWKEIILEVNTCYGDTDISALVGALLSWVDQPNNVVFQQRVNHVLNYLQNTYSLVQEITSANAQLFIEVIEFSLLDTYPRLLAYFSSSLLTQQLKDPKPSLDAALNALSKGESLSSNVLQIMISLLLEYEGILELDDSQLIFSNFAKVFRPEKPDELEKWLRIFPVKLYCNAGSEIQIHLLQSICGIERYVTPRIYNKLEKIITLDLQKNEIEPLIHESWMTLCKHSPESICRYIEQCLLSNFPKIELAESSFDILLEMSDSSFCGKKLQKLLEDIYSQKITCISQRIRLSSEFFNIGRDCIESCLQSPTAESLHQLRRQFNPYNEVDRADMLVAVIDFICIQFRLPPNWMTPMALKAEALCHAKRFREARELSLKYPNLNIGREGSIQYVLQKVQPLAEERSVGVETYDYQRILKTFLHK